MVLLVMDMAQFALLIESPAHPLSSVRLIAFTDPSIDCKMSVE